MKIFRKKFEPLYLDDPEVYGKKIKNYTTPVPSKEVIERYDMLVMPYINRIRRNHTPGYPIQTINDTYPILKQVDENKAFYIGDEVLMLEENGRMYKKGLFSKKLVEDPYEVLLDYLIYGVDKSGANTKIKKLFANLGLVFEKGSIEEVNKCDFWKLSEFPEFSK